MPQDSRPARKLPVQPAGGKPRLSLYVVDASLRLETAQTTVNESCPHSCAKMIPSSRVRNMLRINLMGCQCAWLALFQRLTSNSSSLVTSVGVCRDGMPLD